MGLKQPERLQGRTPPRKRIARFVGVVAPLAVGLGVTAALFAQARAAERRDLQKAIFERAEKQVELLRNQMLRSMEVLHSIASLFASRPQVTADEWRHFVESALARQPELQALGWAPRVSNSGRNEFQRVLRLSSPGSIGLVERDARRAIVPAADRPEYFPVLYIEPIDRNREVLGFDLASDARRREALDRARDSGQPAATAPIELVQGHGEGRVARLGFVVYLACYDGPSATPAERRDHLRGFGSAVFRLQDLLASAAAGSGSDGLEIHIRDDSSGAVVFASTGVAGPGPSGAQSCDVAGRRWTVTFVPRAGFPAQHHAGHAWLVLAGGLVVTLLLVGYLYGGMRRTAVIEGRVVRRTAQLSAEVAERRRAEEASRTAAAQYRSIFENSVEGIFQTTPDGHYLSANRALAEIYGYESPERLVADLADIAIQLYVEPARRSEFAQLMRRHGTVTAFESQVYRRDGAVIWISENARSVYDDHGVLLYYEGAVVDVTERKRAEAARAREHDELEARVRERTEALAAANAAKSRFLASMSHEIRTPMNAILGYAQILQRDPTLRDSQREGMATIVSSGNHLLGLIDGILDLSRIEAGHAELHPADFDLRTLAADLSRMFRQRCEQKGLILRIELPEGCSPLVRGDEGKLRQVLINLLGNAVRFTDAGTVAMTVVREAEACRFEVSDTGIGIPRDALSRIFEPFQQATTDVGRGGSGLGLAIAQQHVRLMGGELTVDSAAGAGSRFSFSVPLPERLTDGRPLRIDAPPRQVERLLAGHRVRAVIIDDVGANRKVLAEMLKAVGCEVTSFDSGLHAVESLAADASAGADIFFVDVLMPGMDGIETAQRLRTLEHLRGARLVATSAAVFVHEQQGYVQSGFHDVLTKPIACERLYECLSRLLGVAFEHARGPSLYESESEIRERAAAEALSLPAQMKLRLRRGAELCGITELRQCADELERRHPPAPLLARYIRGHLQRYDTAPILLLLEESQSLATTEAGAT